MRLVFDSGFVFHRSARGGGVACGAHPAERARRPRPGELRERRLVPCHSCYPPSRRAAKPSERARERSQNRRDRMAELQPIVLARALWRCEVRAEGCLGAASQAHHRLPRGRRGPDTLENLVAVCEACHTASPAAIHRNPAWAEACGLLIPAAAGPPSEPWEPPGEARGALPSGSDWPKMEGNHHGT